MKIFVSYSFRDENAWVERYVIPLISHFGHEPKTGRILDGGVIPDEVMRTIKMCRRVLCFETKAKPNYGPSGGEPISYGPPDWVRDERMMAMGANLSAIAFRELGVDYGGAAALEPYYLFERTNLPGLLLKVAELLKDWPLGPLLFRLSVPNALCDEIAQAASAGTLRALCRARDLGDLLVAEESQEVRMRDKRLTVLFWVKPDPNLTVEIELQFGTKRLVSGGVSPAVHETELSIV
jgi:hypothetical protein